MNHRSSCACGTLVNVYLKNVIKVLREAWWTGAGGEAVILMELLSVLEFKSENALNISVEDFLLSSLLFVC